MKLAQKDILAAAQAPRKHGTRFFTHVLDSIDDPVCKWHAVKAIGLLKDAKAKRHLFSVLKGPNFDFNESSLYLITAWAIGQIGARLTADVLALLKDEKSLERRIALIDSLGEIADPASIPDLSRQLASKSQSVRLWSALSLAKVGPASLPALNRALVAADSELVYIIMDALALIGTDAAVPLILRAFERNQRAVRNYLMNGPVDRSAKCIALAHTSSVIPPRHALRAHSLRSKTKPSPRPKLNVKYTI